MTTPKQDDNSPTRGKTQVIEGQEGGEAVTVEFEEGDAPTPIRTKTGDMSLPPTTTEQEDRITEGQRRTSLLWEGVQGTISLSITIAVIYCQLNDIRSETLNNAFFFVIATYLQRTNHTRVGGVGQRERSGGVYWGR